MSWLLLNLLIAIGMLITFLYLHFVRDTPLWLSVLATLFGGALGALIGLWRKNHGGLKKRKP